MIERTDKEIEEFMRSILLRPKDMKHNDPEYDTYMYDSSIADLKISISRIKNLQVTVSRMYESPPFNLRIAFALAEFFGTRNINDAYRFADSGCETCDYGSSYGYTLEIRP